jgi:hypothetical protein
MLGAYLHEWRRSPPNDRTVLLYERARLYAVQVNESVDLSSIIEAIDSRLAKHKPTTIDAYVIKESERLAYNALFTRDVTRGGEARALAVAFFGGVA